MDIRPMRPEKWRRAYVAWFDSDGDLRVDVVSVRDWSVVEGVWRPAFRYGGRWVWPQMWHRLLPDRALVLAAPGAPRPTDDVLAAGAHTAQRPRVAFVPSPDPTDPEAVTRAREELARADAAAALRPEVVPGDPGWWLPATEEEVQWIDDLTDELHDTDICAPRRRRVGSVPGDPSSLGNSREGCSKARQPDRSERPERGTEWPRKPNPRARHAP